MPRLAALLLLVLLAGPAQAAPANPPFASYWSGFLDFWADWFKNRNAVLFTALIVGALSIFIITRGKKLK